MEIKGSRNERDPQESVSKKKQLKKGHEFKSPQTTQNINKLFTPNAAQKNTQTRFEARLLDASESQINPSTPSPLPLYSEKKPIRSNLKGRVSLPQN